MGKEIALVLGTGAARGYAHIGVIEVLLERGFEIKAISGCSMGALIGGLYAAGKMEHFKDWVSSIDYLAIIKLLDFSWRNWGVIKGERIFKILKEIIGDINIEDLPIAYTAVAVDLVSQKEVWFQRGSLLEAIRASIAIPSVFQPVIKGHRVLVDGGLLNPLPIVPTISAHADLIIAVNVTSNTRRFYQVETLQQEPKESQRIDSLFERLKRAAGTVLKTEAVPNEDKNLVKSLLGKGRLRNPMEYGYLEILHQSLETIQTSLAEYKIAGYPPDVVIEIPKYACRMYDFHKALPMIQLGRAAAEQVLKEQSIES